MKSKMIKIISLCLCIAILASGAAYALASGKDKAENVKTAENITENTAEKQHEEAAAKSDTFKDETVYVLANPDGTVQKIIVSDWIKNTLSSEKITDVTNLKIQKISKVTKVIPWEVTNTRVWDAQGNDIYYQGTIEKELPVDLSVSYKLDGKTVSADELIGKSGKVTIRFDYKNKQYETVKINGKDEKIYVSLCNAGRECSLTTTTLPMFRFQTEKSLTMETKRQF